MKNLKKFFAVLVVVTVLVSSLVMPASAADNFSYADQANKLHDLGLYNGTSTTEFVPDLGTALNRETGVVMLLRIVGLDKTAEAMTDAEATAALAKFVDAKTISTWAKKSVAYATKNGLVVGTTTTTFAPKASLNGKAYCTLILRQLGFKVEGAAYDVAPTTLSEKGAFTAAEGTKFTGKAALIKDDLVGISYGSLNAKDSEGKVLFTKLVDAKVITAEKAAANGLTTAVVSSIAATNGSINVVFNNDIVVAPAATDFTVSQSVYAASETPTVTTVTASVYGYTAATKTAELKVAPVTDAAVKSLYYTVTFKNGTPITSAAITFADVVLSSAASLSSKVVEVSLSAATTATAAAGATYTVKDSAGAAINVTKAELAAYDTANKTVLLTLASDTKAGSLYSLTVGSKTVNFGGKAAETTKPTISSVTSTGFKEVTITYSEGVVLTGTTVVIAEKYGSKAALAVKSMKYNGKDKIVVETDEQKGSTLYGITVTGTADFSGNVMDKDEAKSFAGTAKDTSEIKVTGAAANEPEEAVVEFNVNIDTTTIAVANFKVEEAYGAKTVLPVTAARIATKDDKDKSGTALTDVTAKKNVIISVPGTKTSTLYKVTVSGLKSEAGIGMSATSSETVGTFAGKAKPTDPFTFDINNKVAESNTSVKVVFANKVAKADAEKIENYAIAEAYGSKAALVVKTAELQSDGKSVKLTTASMSASLYKLTVTGVKDIYGNLVKTADSANVVSFTGKAVAAKITKIDSIAYEGTSETVILVNFDQNVGSTASDVSHYSINNDVGYPEKAAADADVADQVKLTLPKLTTGKVYTLTVKGLENADGVAMDTAGVTLTFVGKGVAATLPELTAVIPVDNQTLKIYFDRDVKDSSVDGPIWTSSTNKLVATAFDYKVDAATNNLEGTEYAYQDPSNKNILVVRIGTDDAFKTGSLTLVGNAEWFATNKNSLVFVPIADDPAKIVVENVAALNKRTIRVYFNMPVYANAGTPALGDFAKVFTTNVYGNSTITLSNPVAIDDTNKVYDFKLSADLGTSTYYLNINPALEAANAVIQDCKVGLAGYVGMKDENSSTDGFQQERPFAGNATAAADIKDVYAVMSDDKTIKVYYPQLMNTSVIGTNGVASISAVDLDNYTIVNGSNVAVTMSDNNPFDVTDIGEITYDSKDNTATITLNKSIKTAAGGAFLKIDQLTANATQTAVVIDGTTAISKQFAINTAASTKVKVDSASFNNTTNVLTVTFNQKVKTTADVDVTGSADAGATEIGNLLAALTISIPGLTVDADAITSIAALNADGGAVDNTTTTANVKKIEITFDDGATAGAVGTVVAKAGITGINGNGVDTDASAAPFAQ